MSRSISLLLAVLFTSVVLFVVPAQKASAQTCYQEITAGIVVIVPCPKPPPQLPPNDTRNPSQPQQPVDSNDSDGDGVPDDEENNPDCVALAAERDQLWTELESVQLEIEARWTELVLETRKKEQLQASISPLEGNVARAEEDVKYWNDLVIDRQKQPADSPTEREKRKADVEYYKQEKAKAQTWLDEKTAELNTAKEALEASIRHEAWLQNEKIPALEARENELVAAIARIDQQCGQV